MYNRYVPQPDGSYSRNRMPDRSGQSRKSTPPPPPPPKAPEEHPQECRLPDQELPKRQHTSPGNFLRQLLPKDFDTGDLIVILLLLLMAGDCEEDRNNAILTIALYFLM